MMDLLRLSRDSGTNAQFILKGVNLSDRECPYTLVVNLKEFDKRLLSQLASSQIEIFKQIVQTAGCDILAAVIIVETFFSKEVCFNKAPIISRICDVLRDNQDGKLNLDQSWLPAQQGLTIKPMEPTLGLPHQTSKLTSSTRVSREINLPVNISSLD